MFLFQYCLVNVIELTVNIQCVVAIYVPREESK